MKFRKDDESFPATGQQGLSSDIVLSLDLSMAVGEIKKWWTSPLVGVLFGGDRLSCCDEGVALRRHGDLVGLATIAPKGKEQNGVPTIVGLYVLPQFRRQGYGGLLLKLAIRRCMQRFPSMELNMSSSRIKRAFESLPEDVRSFVTIIDYGSYFDDDMALTEEGERKLRDEWDDTLMS